MTQIIHTSPRQLNTKCFMQLLQTVAIENGYRSTLFSCGKENLYTTKNRLRINKQLG